VSDRNYAYTYAYTTFDNSLSAGSSGSTDRTSLTGDNYPLTGIGSVYAVFRGIILLRRIRVLFKK